MIDNKEYIVTSGQLMRTASGKALVLKRVKGVITLEEIASKVVHTLVTGYPGDLQMRLAFITRIGRQAIGEAVAIARPAGKRTFSVAGWNP